MLQTGKEEIDSQTFFQLATDPTVYEDIQRSWLFHNVLLQFRSHSSAWEWINCWNALPQHVVDAPSTNAFKNRLDKQTLHGYGCMKVPANKSINHKYKEVSKCKPIYRYQIYT